jgi:hypothetical protein
MSNNKTNNHVLSSGRVLADGTIVELFARDDGKTAFVVARGESIDVVDSFDDADVHLLPIPSSNNLLRHEALLLPRTPLAFDTVEALLAEIRVYIRRYVDLSPDFLAVVSAYVLFSWVYDAFNELPYLRFRGDFGSGKTRALTIIGSIMYKGFFASGASTVSPIFYTLDAFRGSLVIDEADFRFTDKDSDIAKILNNGNVRGFPVLRQSMNQKREFDPRAFQVYGPKIVAMRFAFDDQALESRFLTEEMGQRAVRADIPINLPDVQATEAAELRSKLLMYRLTMRNRVALDPSLVDAAKSARINQILVPLLSVAPSDAERRAIERVANRVDRELRIDRGESPEAAVLRILIDLLNGKEQGVTRIAEIAELLGKRVGLAFERPITPKYVGWIVRKRLHLETYKSHGTYVIGPSEHEKIAVLAKRYGVLDD